LLRVQYSLHRTWARDFLEPEKAERAVAAREDEVGRRERGGAWGGGGGGDLCKDMLERSQRGHVQTGERERERECTRGDGVRGLDVVLSLLPGGVDVREGRGGEGREAWVGQVNVSTILKAQDVVQRCAAQVYDSGLVNVLRLWFSLGCMSVV
jgi:hypothetical protein